MEPGTRLGDYQILEPLGRGGMGEVYRAHDPSLGRDVAIKVLPAEVAEDRDRLARLEREARLLAALNHPNVAIIHGLEEAEGDDGVACRFLVLEVVEGLTLEERLRSGPLRVREALEFALQMARGLEAAHERGIVHRDLKPANVKLTPDGRVKVLDFGLARSVAGAAGGHDAPDDVGRGAAPGEPDVPAGSAQRDLRKDPGDGDIRVDRELTHSPTGPARPGFAATEAGTLLGTAPYMSPEQARGEAVDERADVWAFGCVLYEMLTSGQAFRGDSVAEVLAAVLRGEPDLEALPAAVPWRVRDVLRRCLRKDPDRRLHAVADARIDLEEVRARPEEVWPEEIRQAFERTDRLSSSGEFRITQEVCRKLDRESLDPRLIGTQMIYLDNGVRSDVLVVHLHGLGLDHREFAPLLRVSEYRSLAPTQVGFEPRPRTEFRLSGQDHVVLLREFVRDAVRRLEPSITVLTGFSVGADLGFRIIAEADADPVPIDGFIPLGGNLHLDTCFLTRLLADLAEVPDAGALELAHRLTAFAGTLDEWLNITGYLVKIFRKYGGDVRPLQPLARDIVEPFRDGTRQAFVDWYRAATAAVRRVRCVFEDQPGAVRHIDALRLQNLDDEVFGPRYREESIVVEEGTDHYDLAEPERMERHVREVVELLRRP